MQVVAPNNVKIYSVTSASRSAIPDWQVQRNLKKLKKDTGWRNRIELLQDFGFPEAANKLKQTPDGQYIMGTGVYKPQLRTWDLAQLSMKFERHTDAENVNFEILSQDWQKTVHLQTDRSIEVHSHYGMHYRTRIPRFGRDLRYHFPSCDLYSVGDSSEVYRLNLEEGRFLSGLETLLPEINTLEINPAHQMLAFGGSNGQMEFWDPRARKRIASLDISGTVAKTIDAALLDELPQVTSICFDYDGLSMMTGTSTGQVVLHDMRHPAPILIKDHQYGFPIKSLTFHQSGNCISADTKICKIWNKETGNIFTNIEPPSDINDVCVFKDSGLIMMAVEGTQIQSYYVPQLGTAPKWCPFLDNLTEELEENPNQNLYDDYKFVTKKELINLGMDHLIGTNVLKAYMHGFFVDHRLYEKKARAIANPFEFEEHKKRMVKKRLEEKRQSRIASKKLPKVNKQLAQQLLEKESGPMENPLGDDRFAAMFKDDDFQVDTTSHEYKLHHPSEVFQFTLVTSQTTL
ncbi:WD40-repeat-containing domain protein [Gorgonomyces haynaldii]|nr:WD40-repeat-containing domain protein [Gorgonomyces haynaldii]